MKDILGIKKDIDTINWSALDKAYGDKEIVPENLERLLSDERNVVKESISALSNIIYHQGTIYNSTIFSIPILVKILTIGSFKERGSLLHLISLISYGKNRDTIFNSLKKELAKFDNEFFEFMGKGIFHEKIFAMQILLFSSYGSTRLLEKIKDQILLFGENELIAYHMYIGLAFAYEEKIDVKYFNNLIVKSKNIVLKKIIACIFGKFRPDLDNRNAILILIDNYFSKNEDITSILSSWSHLNFHSLRECLLNYKREILDNYFFLILEKERYVLEIRSEKTKWTNYKYYIFLLLKSTFDKYFEIDFDDDRQNQIFIRMSKFYSKNGNMLNDVKVDAELYNIFQFISKNFDHNYSLNEFKEKLNDFRQAPSDRSQKN